MNINFIKINYLWFVLLSGILLGILSYYSYKYIEKISNKEKLRFTIIRSIAIFLILLSILQPILTIESKITQKSKIMILADNSASMGILSRKDILKSILKSEIIKDIAKRFNISCFKFGKNYNYFTVEDIDSITASEPETRIDEALRLASGFSKTELVSGILLFSDGQNNSTGNPVKEAESISYQKIPIYTIGIGDERKIKDISVDILPYDEEANLDKLCTVSADIKSSGYSDKRVNIILREDGKVIEIKPIVLKENLFQKVQFSYRPKSLGIRKLSIEADVLPDEVIADNNKQLFFIKVIKSKYHVLLLYGKPDWEYKFLNKTLRDDANLEVDSFCKTKQNSFDDFTRKNISGFDLVILGNIKAKDLQETFLKNIKQLVEKKGGSLLLLGGVNSFYNGGWQASFISDVIPIIWDSAVGIYEDLFTLKITDTGITSPVMKLSDDLKVNERIWASLPPCEMQNVVKKVKTGTEVISVNSKRNDLVTLAFSRYGQGRVGIFTVYPTWKWDFLSQGLGKNVSYYSIFYRQLVRYLVATKVEQFSLTTDKLIYQKGDEVNIVCTVYDKNFNPLSDAKVIAKIYMDEKFLNEFALQNSKINPERYTGKFNAQNFGEYTVSVNMNHPQLHSNKSTQFIVKPGIVEYQNLNLNSELLKKLAKITGGEYVNYKEIGKLKDLLVEKKSSISIKREFELWNSWLILIIVIALFSFEWYLRKSRGLL